MIIPILPEHSVVPYQPPVTDAFWFACDSSVTPACHPADCLVDGRGPSPLRRRRLVSAYGSHPCTCTHRPWVGSESPQLHLSSPSHLCMHASGICVHYQASTDPPSNSPFGPWEALPWQQYPSGSVGQACSHPRQPLTLHILPLPSAKIAYPPKPCDLNERVSRVS